MRLLPWAARKACEMHVVLNVLAVLSLGQLLTGDGRLAIGQVYLALMAPTAAAVAAWTLVRSQRSGAVEREFAAWFHVPPGHELLFSNGWWTVEEAEDGRAGTDGQSGRLAAEESS